MALDQLLPDYVGNAQRAYDQGKQRQQADIEQQKSELGELAGYLLSVPEEQRAAVWQSQVAPRVEKLIPGAGREAYGPHVADIAQWAVQEYGKQQQQPAHWQNLGNGYVMDGQGNTKQVYQDQPKPEKPDWGYIPDPNNPDNEVYARREGNQFFALDGSPLYGGGNAPQSAPAAPQGVMGELLALGQTPGVTPTSGIRSPSHNAEVGGKPNSQHLAGTAMDYQIPAALKAQFRALVGKNPDLEVIDEGDHMHVQVRHGGGGGGGGIPGSRPRYKQGAEGGQYATLSPQEVKALGLPAGTVAQRSPSGQVQIVNKPRDIPGASQTVIDNGDGTQTIVPAGKTTEDQNKAAGWYRSSKASLATINEIAKRNPSALMPGLVETYGAVDEVKQRSRDADRQKVEQAYSTLKMDFLHAATGAGFTEQEAADEWRAISPQRGDKQQVINQKLAMAGIKLESMRMRAGGALAGGGGAAQPAPAAPRRLKYNPATGKIE